MDQPATEDIGGRLRRAREARGRSLQDVAAVTRLSVHTLRAIERNEFTKLPDGIYRKAYLRTVAAEVGLDPDAIGADFDAWRDRHIDTSAIVPAHDTRDEKWIRELTPSPRQSAITLAVLVVLSTVWFARQSLIMGPLDAIEGERVSSQVVPNSFDRMTALDAYRGSARFATVSDPAGAPLRIAITAEDWCWVAADRDGERVMYRMLDPGEQVVFEGEQMIRLRLGNAGAVTLSINDGPRRSPGREGEVIDLEVTPDNVNALRDTGTLTLS